MTKKLILLVTALTAIFMVTGCQMLGDQYTDTQTLEYDNVSTITIKAPSAEIKVIKDTRDTILVNFQTYENGEELRCTEGQDTIIEIYNDTPIDINLNINTDYKLTVYVPEEYNGDMNFDLSAGSITMNDFNLQDVDLKLSSGTITFDNVITNSFDVEMSSGNISLADFTGPIKGTESSGVFSVSYKDAMADLDFEASSGTIKVDYSNVETIEGNFTLTKSSGTINQDLNLDEYTENGNKIKGSLGSGTHTIALTISSGIIDITK